jgi:hypothetical protein
MSVVLLKVEGAKEKVLNLCSVRENLNELLDDSNGNNGKPRVRLGTRLLDSRKIARMLSSE